jgi:hypothetical protein
MSGRKFILRLNNRRRDLLDIVSKGQNAKNIEHFGKAFDNLVKVK